MKKDMKDSMFKPVELNKPKYDLETIKYGIDAQTFERALGLYEKGNVKDFKDLIKGYEAKVKGTETYNVFVSKNNYDIGNCNCYIGKQDILCKHMIAVALHAIFRGEIVPEEQKEILTGPESSMVSGEITAGELKEIKKKITESIKYIKAYNGPSKKWFIYQNSLDEGVARLTKIVSDIPVGVESGKLLVDLLLRLDKKLAVGGIDDSNGTVGNFIYGVVSVLHDYCLQDPKIKKVLKKLSDREICFGWEESLVRLYDEWEE